MQNEITKYRLLTKAYDAMIELNNASDKTLKIELIKKNYASLGFSEEVIDWLINIIASVLKIQYNTIKIHSNIPAPNKNIKNTDFDKSKKPNKETDNYNKPSSLKKATTHIHELEKMGITIDLPKEFNFSNYLTDGISVTNKEIIIDFTKASKTELMRYNIENNDQLANFVFGFVKLIEKSSMVIDNQSVPYGMYNPVFDSKNTQYTFVMSRELNFYLVHFKCESNKIRSYKKSIFNWIDTIEIKEL